MWHEFEQDTPAKTRARCSWSAEERAEWLRLLGESGQTVSEFCRANDAGVDHLAAATTKTTDGLLSHDFAKLQLD